jgi:phenylpyruvate tautomerase PptA (4-oxalocrotonate tautomerase family)
MRCGANSLTSHLSTRPMTASSQRFTFSGCCTRFAARRGLVLLAKGHHAVPLVRIDVIEGRSDEEVRALANAVQDVMMEVFAAPPRDRYQVIHEHWPGRLIAEDTGLGLDRSDRVVIIQVTEQGRSDSQKKALYAALATSLESRAGVSPSDLIVSVVANTNADWSFGLGRAQFLEGDLYLSSSPAPRLVVVQPGLVNDLAMPTAITPSSSI